MLGVAIFTAPVEWLFGNPVLTYNVAYIGSYVLAGFGMFLLTRALWGSTAAALLSGLAFALTPYRLAQTSHLQVLMNGWMPIGLLALHRYLASGSRRWLAAFAAAYLLTALSNAYYTYFFLLPIGVVIGIELVRPRLPRTQILRDLTVAGLAIAAVMAPIALVYIRLQRDMGFTRDVGQLGGLSARLADYFRVAAGAWNWGGLLPDGGGERQLFHGFTVIVFAVVGASIAARGPHSAAGWRPIADGDDLRIDRAACRLAVDGARPVASVPPALQLRSRLQRHARTCARWRQSSSSRCRCSRRRLRVAFQSAAAPVRGHRGDRLRCR